jgi:hypothetical protein
MRLLVVNKLEDTEVVRVRELSVLGLMVVKIAVRGVVGVVTLHVEQ